MTGKPEMLLRILCRLAIKEGRNIVVISNQELANALGTSESGFRVMRATLASMKLVEFGSQVDHVGRGIKTWYRLKKPSSAPSAPFAKYRTFYAKNISNLLDVKDNTVKGAKRTHTSNKPTGNMPTLSDGSTHKGGKMKAGGAPKRGKGAEPRQDKGSRLKTELSESFGPAERVVLLKRAGAIIGTEVSPYTAYGRQCKKVMMARLREGYTVDDLVKTCEYAAKEWENGDKWRQLKDLCYIWGRGFQVSLATKGLAGKRDRRQPEFAKGEDREKWLEDIKRRTEGA